MRNSTACMHAPGVHVRLRMRACTYMRASVCGKYSMYVGCCCFPGVDIVMACTVMAYIVMACVVMADLDSSSLAEAYVVMACVVMADLDNSSLAEAYVVMACMVMAYIVMIVMADLDSSSLAEAYVVMACIVMAYIVMADLDSSSLAERMFWSRSLFAFSSSLIRLMRAASISCQNKSLKSLFFLLFDNWLLGCGLPPGRSFGRLRNR